MGDFQKILVKSRRQKFKTSKDFYVKHKFSFTYARYSSIERGEIPSIKIALEIIKNLNLDERHALNAWVRDKMPTEHTKNYFLDIDEETSLNLARSKENRINRMQAQLIRENPIYFDILTYLSIYSKYREINIKRLSQLFKSDVEDMSIYLNNLYNYGLINKNEGGNYFLLEWIVIPDQEEYQDIRNANFHHAIQSHRKKGVRKDTFQNTVTRLVSEEQRDQIKAKIKTFLNWLVGLEDEKKGTAYTILICGNKRYDD